MAISTQPLGSGYSSCCEHFGSSAAGNAERRASVADQLMDVARYCPKAIALSAGPDRMTFGDLAARSMRLASYLIELGAGPEVPIALCLERSFDFIVSAL